MRTCRATPAMAVIGLAILATGTASAQSPYWRSGYVAPRSQPVLSPWLNLTNGGNQALNYFNGVVPQRAFNNQINQLQRSVQANQQAINGLQTASPLGPTGHPVMFLSYQQYFNTLTGGAAGGHYGGQSATAGMGTAGVGTGMPSNVSGARSGATRTR